MTIKITAPGGLPFLGKIYGLDAKPLEGLASDYTVIKVPVPGQPTPATSRPYRTTETEWEFIGVTFHYCAGPTCTGRVWGRAPDGKLHSSACNHTERPEEAYVRARHHYHARVAAIIAYENTTLPAAVR